MFISGEVVVVVVLVSEGLLCHPLLSLYRSCRCDIHCSSDIRSRWVRWSIQPQLCGDIRLRPGEVECRPTYEPASRRCWSCCYTIGLDLTNYYILSTEHYFSFSFFFFFFFSIIIMCVNFIMCFLFSVLFQYHFSFQLRYPNSSS